MSSEEKTNDENFVPPSDWDRKKESDTLILMLPGFRKEQLKVQVSSDRKLRLSGERKISENKWRRFRKEEQLSEIYDTSGIGAKFEAGMLYVRLPKNKPEEPSKSDQQQTTPPDQKPDSSSDKKDQEEIKTETQKPPPKGDHDQDSQKKPEEEKSTVAPEEKNKVSEDKEMQHETTQTALKGQNKDLLKKLSQKEEDHGDVQKKLAQKELDDEDVQKKLAQKKLDDENVQKKLAQKKLDDEDVQKKLAQKKLDEEDVQKKLAQKKLDDEDVQKKLAQKEKGKAKITDGKMGRGSFEELSKRSVVKMKQWFEMICGLVEEVKKQKKLPHFVVLTFLVLLIGLYIKSFVKSSFGGDKDQEL